MSQSQHTLLEVLHDPYQFAAMQVGNPGLPGERTLILHRKHNYKHSNCFAWPNKISARPQEITQ